MPNAFVAGIKKAFPFISAAASLGGPFGVMAASMVGKALGADKAPDSSSDSITNAIASAMASPEQRQALLKAEQDFQLQMAELGYKNAEEIEATGAADRASARSMQVSTRSWIPGTLAVSVTVGFFGLLTLTAMHAPPVSSEKVLDVMTGSLGTAWIMVMGYYFGSSAGSAAKTELLAQAQPISKAA
jgi:hypothetical protein